MCDIQQYLPDGFYWEPGIGLVEKKGKEKCIAEAIPIIMERAKIVDHNTNCIKRTVKIQYLNCSNKEAGELQEYTEEEITSGAYLKTLPIEVCIREERIARKVFKLSMQMQAKDVELQQIERYAFGWHGNNFHWLTDGEADNQEKWEYSVATAIAALLSRGNNAVVSLVLAMAHGPLKRFLQSAGIQHDFVTFIVGETSVGKTALAKTICSYLKGKEVVFSVGSKRAELKKAIQNTRDITVVLDDFCKSGSDRVISSQLQTLSEIIQAASDAGGEILDEKSICQMDNCIHLVVTSEKIIHNPSTMNRCFLANMDEPLRAEAWNFVTAIGEQGGFCLFMVGLMKYIECHFDEVKGRCKADYSYHQQSIRENGLMKGRSLNRMADTLAVQLAIKGILIGYMRTVGIDEKLRGKAEKSMVHCIEACGQELDMELNEMQKDESCMKLLPLLAEVCMASWMGYKIVNSEEAYRKARIKRKNVIGFCKTSGYISFDLSYMVNLMEEWEDGITVSKSRLGKELGHYHLAHVDPSEAKQCCRWHTQGKYYHVDFRRLLELVYNLQWKAEGKSIDVEEQVRIFEREGGCVYRWQHE